MTRQHTNRNVALALGAAGAVTAAVYVLQTQQRDTQSSVNRVVLVHSDNILYTDLNSLETAADIIAIAHPTASFDGREHIVTRYPDGAVQDFYTKTQLKLEKVFKGSNKTAHLGDFYALEPVGLIAEKNERVKLKSDGYNELEKDKRYIVFLKANGSGEYSIINMNNGKILYDKKEEKDLDLEDVSEKGKTLRDQARAKFKL